MYNSSCGKKGPVMHLTTTSMAACSTVISHTLLSARGTQDATKVHSKLTILEGIATKALQSVHQISPAPTHI